VNGQFQALAISHRSWVSLTADLNAGQRKSWQENSDTSIIWLLF
jgi:hypothetical protein